MDMGVANPSAQGQAMISTDTATMTAWAKARVRTEVIPDAKSDEGNTNDDRYEISGDGIGQLLDRCPRTLGQGDHFDDLGEQGVASYFFGPHGDCAGGVDRSANHLVALLFLNRNRLTRDH